MRLQYALWSSTTVFIRKQVNCIFNCVKQLYNSSLIRVVHCTRKGTQT